MRQQRQLTTERNASIVLTDVFPEYQEEGIAIGDVHIILCKRGRSVINVNFQDYVQEPGTVLLLFPGDIDQLKEISDDFEIVYLVFSGDMQREVTSDLSSMETIRRNPFIKSPEIARMAESMLSFRQSLDGISNEQIKRQATILQVRSYFLAYNSYLVEHGLSETEYPTRQAKLFAELVKLLRTYHKESRNVSFYAEKMNMTPRYLNLIVNSEGGMSAKDIIDHYCIMQLKLELQDQRRTVSDLAWEYHFSSVSSFSNYFKLHTKFSPSEYRSSSNEH